MKKLIYFVGLKEIPLERHLYVLSLAPGAKFPARRLTESGHSHTTIAFEPSMLNYYLNIQSNISTPPYGFVHRYVPDTKTLPSKTASTKNISVITLKFQKLGLIVTNNYLPSSVTSPGQVTSPVGSPSTSPPPPSLVTINERLDLLPGLPRP